MRVDLKGTLTARVEQFESDRTEAAALMRHWSFLRMNGLPLFDGFDPLPTP